MDNPGFQNDEGIAKPLPKKPPLVRANSLMVPINKSWVLTQPVRPKLCRCNSVLVPKTCCLEEFEKSPEKTAKDLSSFFNKFSSPTKNSKHSKHGDQALWPRPPWTDNYDRLRDSNACESKTKISTIYEPKFLTSKMDYNGWSKTKHTASDSGGDLKKELWPGGWKLEFVDTRHITASQKVATILCAFILTLLASGNVIYILRTVQTSTEGPNKSAWIDVVLIHGEFRITNEPYRESLSNTSSEDFQRLSGLLSQQIDNLFSLSAISGPYHSAAVTHLTPGLVAHCQIVLKSTDEGASGNVGLAFLGGLRHQHGKVWLGNFSIDILSIGFQSNSDGISWSEWTEWSDCKETTGLGLVRVRSRNCTLRSGAYLYSTIPCLLIPQSRGNIETLPCRHYRRASPLQIVSTTTPVIDQTSSTTVQQPVVAASSTTVRTAATNTHAPTVTMTTPLDVPSTPTTMTTTIGVTSTLITSSLSSSTPLVDYGSVEVVNVTEEISNNSTASLNVMNLTVASNVEPVSSTNNRSSERKTCECGEDEVCVALVDETVPQCVKVKDSTDPTGCGGHCKINIQICQRIQGNAYRCVDDSKCLDDEWQCGNKLCIPFVKRCDGHFNCYDHTDEFECDCNLTTHFHCGNQMSCIPLSKRCDAIVDCWDAADEINCTTHCVGAEQFTCNDSQCIPNHRFCDGFADCRDRSDEPFGCGGECKKHEWRCSNTRCISKANVCNKIDDCGDNSDETGCVTSN